MPALVKRFLPLAVIGVAMLVVWRTGLHDWLSLRALVEHRRAIDGFVAEHGFMSVMAYMGVYTVAVALSLPGAVILTIVGGLLFGWLVGGTATVLAATIGASIIFLAAKTSLGGVLREKAGPFLDRLARGFGQDAFNYLLFLRLVPAFPFWLVNLAPAFLDVPLRIFFVATLIGIVPGTFAFSFVGGGLGSVVDMQAKSYMQCVEVDPSGATCTVELDTGALVTPELIVGFAALGVAALIPVVIKKLRARRKTA